MLHNVNWIVHPLIVINLNVCLRQFLSGWSVFVWRRRRRRWWRKPICYWTKRQRQIHLIQLISSQLVLFWIQRPRGTWHPFISNLVVAHVKRSQLYARSRCVRLWMVQVAYTIQRQHHSEFSLHYNDVASWRLHPSRHKTKIDSIEYAPYRH